MNDDSLGEFFRRPVQIHQFQWSTTVAAFEDINPWALFIENPRVANRMSNFRCLKGNLCVKVMINGNGFYYGRMICNYIPLPFDDDFTRNRALITQDLVEASQRPHFYLNPTTSEGGELCLPFLWDKDSLGLPDNDYDNMGTLNFRQLNPLRHANGATDPLDITVFAWMENVTLSVPTNANISNLTAQSGTEANFRKKPGAKKTTFTRNDVSTKKDEYGDGMISRPASIVARLAGKLYSVPYIGPYMKATEVAASGVANIAKIFGYSRPTNVEDIKKYVPKYGTELAISNTADTCSKMSLDVKQELTIDGRVTGAGSTDEMSMNSITTREAYIGNISMSTSDNNGTVLQTITVNPVHGLTVDAGATELIEYHVTPAAYVANVFQYWRGTMRYRFQIVASAFHKGRLLIQWDPFGYSGIEANVAYSQIVDISEDKDFTLDIGWGSPLGWLECDNLINVGNNFVSGTTAASNTNRHNGVITVSVLNSLSSPSAGSEPISINVFAATGDDFEFAVPKRFPIGTQIVDDLQSGLEVQSGHEDGGNTVGAEENSPVAPTTLTSFGKTSSEYEDSLVYFGEDILSLRTLLKRYSTAGAYTISNDSGLSYVTYEFRHIPPHYGGAESLGASVWPGGGNKNFNSNNYISYFSACYVACRGGVRWKAVSQNFRDGLTAYAHIDRDLNASPGFVGSSLEDPYRPGRTIEPGTVMTPVNENPVLEFEVPYQTNRRFFKSRKVRGTGRLEDDMCWEYRLCQDSGGTARTYRTEFYVAAAEDFSLHMF